jgi:L-glyceraldehyde 3-phosphate reductase
MTAPLSADRYASMSYRRCGRSGLHLPAISLGLWQGTGSYVDESLSREIVLTAFNAGITHFDLANNYGNPAGASESLFGKLLQELPRHEVVVSTKAGYRMWPGPYGDGGSRKYLIDSCEQSLRRLGIDHVDIFYSHRLDLDTPLEETLGALETLVAQGKALYAGVSNYPDPHFTRAVEIMRQRQWAPITIHQPRYNLLDRIPETTVLPTAGREGVGVIAFSPLAQGLLTGKYLGGIPADSRVALGMGNGAMGEDRLSPATLGKIQKLAVIAHQRGQSLAQLALAWVLRDPRVTSALIGASKPQQVVDCVAALKNLRFTADELAAIEACLVG